MNDLRFDHECSPAHRVHFDPTVAGQPSNAIVGALATVRDRSPTAIAPLYEAIDVDALERLLDHAAVSTADAASFGLEFSVDDLDVVVTADGRISVYDCGDDGESDVEFTYDQ